MKPFYRVAVPHRDIIEERFGMNVYAANLWEVHSGRAPDEYKDAETFFRKTYLTEGLKNLLNVVENRLKGRGGDSVIQIQTPFGGGKTHALIAMYHKAKEWKAKTVVIVGTQMSTNQTIWGMIEEQLTGSVKKLSGYVTPGGEALHEILEKNQPVLILIDEILEYATKAAGVPVMETTLGAQTIAFMNELTEVAGTMSNVCVLITLPSSALEHYDKNAEEMFQKLQKVVGRVERIYTPVQESEVTKVIRRRLFSEVNEKEASKIISSFSEYAEKERILPPGMELSEYRKRFADSYPFLPHVVEVLYHRWGSFPTFQRTRGVLRLLALVISSLMESERPYITLSDFDLSNSDIRRELIKHIGNEYDSVIAADITNPDSGSKSVDKALGNSFRGLMLGTRASTAIFLYSFAGGHERGATIGEVKRSATIMDNPSNAVTEAVEQLKSKLFYLQRSDDRYYFSNTPNLNRIVITKMENIKDSDLIQRERELLSRHIKGKRFNVSIWEDSPRAIPDMDELQLIILKEKNESLLRDMVENRGDSPRVYRNALLFLYPFEGARNYFIEILKRNIAYEQIKSDSTLSLTKEQKEEVEREMKREKENLDDAIRTLYRLVSVPSKDGFKEIDLGVATYGEEKGIDEEVYERLRQEGEILAGYKPPLLRETYLKEREYIKVYHIYDTMLKTPGESRPISRAVIEESIRQGVKGGLFGIGHIENESIVCRAFKEDTDISLSDESLILINAAICEKQKQLGTPTLVGTIELKTPEKIIETSGTVSSPTAVEMMNELTLQFSIPHGKIYEIMRIMHLLQEKFHSLKLEIKASDGSISKEDYENKIREAFKQLDIDI